MSEDNFQEGSDVYMEGNFGAFDQCGVIYHSTIRSLKCPMLVKFKRCKKCDHYRKRLHRSSSRLKSKQSDKTGQKSSKHKQCKMTKGRLIEKMNHQKREIKSLEAEISKLRRQYLGYKR